MHSSLTSMQNSLTMRLEIAKLKELLAEAKITTSQFPHTPFCNYSCHCTETFFRSCPYKYLLTDNYSACTQPFCSPTPLPYILPRQNRPSHSQSSLYHMYASPKKFFRILPVIYYRLSKIRKIKHCSSPALRYNTVPANHCSILFISISNDYILR